MKICPKCGYRELEYWRQNRWRTNVEFTRIAEFQLNYPEISRSLIETGKIQIDKYYAYRLSGKYKQIVERIIREMKKEMKLRSAFIAMVIEACFETHPLSCPHCGKPIIMKVSEK